MFGLKVIAGKLLTQWKVRNHYCRCLISQILFVILHKYRS